MVASICHIFCIYLAVAYVAEAGTFTVDYERNVFLKDSKPFRYASGSIHYSRVPPQLWRDRLQKMRAGGLNAIQTYVPWNFHETSPGIYNFEGERDLMQFLEIAQDVGLLVLLRPGPYICAEWEFGGFPSWLLQNESLRYRSSDPAYLKPVDAWLSVLLDHMKPYLYVYGGPVVMVQVENEYGSYGCDHAYIDHLVAAFRSALGPQVVLYSTDGCSSEAIKCGSSSDLFTTVDFGVGSNPADCFGHVRAYQPRGPLVNSEFYTGWLDHWGEQMHRVDAHTFAESLDRLLSHGESVSVNMYMYEGGTNFGFMNGANAGATYQSSITSYDYDAPLTEAGDTTEKFDLVRQVLGKHIPLPPAHLPPNAPKTAYGRVPMTEYCSFFDAPLITRIADGIDPVPMEDTDQSYGYVLYALRPHLTPGKEGNTKKLTFQGVHDRAYVYLDRVLQGVLQRKDVNQETMSLSVTLSPSSVGLLQVLVENQGRINYGHLLETDKKGILNGVLIDGQKLTNWTSSSVPMNGSFPESMFQPIPLAGVDQASTALFRGELPSFPKGTTANDTYLMLTGWTKGVVFVNNFNIGRYWSAEPPQRTLYVPSSLLRVDGAPNAVVVFEQDHSPCTTEDRYACSITSVDKPVFV